MAPGQVPHPAVPWRDAHRFFLLSPLVGLLSRAWSRLRGPGPPQPWFVQAVIEETALDGEANASLASHHAPWGGHPQGKAEDSRGTEEDEEADGRAHPDLKANIFFLHVSNDDDDECGEEKATSMRREHGGEFTDSRPAFLPPSLLIRSLGNPPGEEESKKEVGEEGVVNNMEITTAFSCPLSRWECCPGVEEKDEAKEAPRTSFSLSPGCKPTAWACCPGEGEEEEKDEEDQATGKERRVENKQATKTDITPSCSGSNSRAWECYPGESEEEPDTNAKEATEKGEPNIWPQCSSLSQRPLIRAWVYQPGEDTEEEENEESDAGAAEEEGEAEGPSSVPLTSAFQRAWMFRPGEDSEEEDEDSDSEVAEEEGEAEGPSSIPPTSAFLKTWVYRPGEDSEEEDGENSDSEVAEEEGEAEGPSSILPTSAFLKAWVYQPGEEEGEDSDSEAAQEEGEAEGPSSIPSTSAVLKTWVYRPGEDSEEDNEENEDGVDDSEAADSGTHPALHTRHALCKTCIYQLGEDSEQEGAAEEWGEAEPSPFPVAIYLPGEKPPPPWAPPRLPLRLQRRLKSFETPTRDPDPETPLKTTKVRFSEKVSIHYLAVWAGPAQAARQGPWEQLARDRSRFARRIACVQEKLDPCLTPAARARAWARLGNPPISLTPIPVLTQTAPSSSDPSSSLVLARHQSPTLATPYPFSV